MDEIDPADGLSDDIALGDDAAGGTLAERIFARLTEAILRGELAPGSKISEPVLAQRYGVSRGPLREALHRLQERQLITRSANQGARVVHATPEMLNSIFSIREVLEGLAVREATLNMSETEIAALAENVRSHAEKAAIAAPGFMVLGSADSDFHFQIAQGSRNPLLIHLLCTELYPLLRLYRSHQDSELMRSRALLEHKRILSAIEDRDAELAEFLMRRHIARAGRRRFETWQPTPAES